MINARSGKVYGKVVRRREERKCRFTSILPSGEKMFLSFSLADTSRKANKVTVNLPKQDPVPLTHYAIF